MKLRDSIKKSQDVWWVVSTFCGVIAFIVLGTVYLRDKDILLTATAEQMDSVKDEAAAAKKTAERAAYEVESLQGSVAKSAVKLDTIVEQLGNTSGKIDTLIQMQRSPFAGFKILPKQPDGPQPDPERDIIVVQNPQPRVITQ